MTTTKYTKDVKNKIIKLHLEGGRTIKSLTNEFQLGQGTLSYWLVEYRKECQTNPKQKEESLSYAETKLDSLSVPEFVKLSKKIRRHYDGILATVKHNLSNARIESMNNKIKILIRKSYGFRNIKT